MRPVECSSRIEGRSSLRGESAKWGRGRVAYGADNLSRVVNDRDSLFEGHDGLIVVGGSRRPLCEKNEGV